MEDAKASGASRGAAALAGLRAAGSGLRGDGTGPTFRDRFRSGAQKASAGLQRQAGFLSSGLINQLTYNMGQFGMVADQALTSLVQGLLRIPKVGLPILFVIGLIITGFFTIKKTIGNFGEAGKRAMENFKKTLLVVKDTAIALLAPFFDLFAGFLGAGKEGGESMDDMGKGLERFSQNVKKAAENIKEFVEKYVVPFVSVALNVFKTIASAVWKVIGGFILLVRGLFEKFKGDSTKGGEMIEKAFSQIGEGLKKLFKMLLNFLTQYFAPLVIEIITLLAISAVNLLEQIPIGVVNAARWSLKAINNLFFEALKFLAKGLGWIPGLGGKIRGALQAMQNGISGAIDFVGDKINGLIGKTSNVIRNLGDQAKVGIKKLGEKIETLMPGVGKGLLKAFLNSFKKK